MESVLNGFYLLTNFVNLSILDICRILENCSTWWIYVIKSINVTVSILDSRQVNATDTIVLFFTKTILHQKTFRVVTNTMVFFSEIPKHNVTCSASSIFYTNIFFRFDSAKARLYINFEWFSRICNNERYTDSYFNRSLFGTLVSFKRKKTTIRGTGLWTINNSLTKDQNYKTEIKKIIRNFSNENESLLNCQIKRGALMKLKKLLLGTRDMLQKKNGT